MSIGDNIKNKVMGGGAFIISEMLTMTLFHHSVLDFVLDAAIGTFIGGAVYVGNTKSSLTWEQYIASKNSNEPQSNNTETPTEQMTNDVIMVRKQIWKLDDLSKSIRNPNISRQLKDIIEVCRDISSSIESTPKSTTSSVLWIKEYFPRFVIQTEKYRDLAVKGETSSEVQKVLIEFETMLPAVLNNFREVLDGYLESDITDFSVSTAVYNRIVKNNSGKAA